MNQQIYRCMWPLCHLWYVYGLSASSTVGEWSCVVCWVKSQVSGMSNRWMLDGVTVVHCELWWWLYTIPHYCLYYYSFLLVACSAKALLLFVWWFLICNKTIKVVQKRKRPIAEGRNSKHLCSKLMTNPQSWTSTSVQSKPDNHVVSPNASDGFDVFFFYLFDCLRHNHTTRLHILR